MQANKLWLTVRGSRQTNKLCLTVRGSRQTNKLCLTTGGRRQASKHCLAIITVQKGSVYVWFLLCSVKTFFI
jgi:hypothetical protein